MKIGDEVYVHGYVDEIRNDVIIIRNNGGYFGTVPNEIERKDEPQKIYCPKCGSSDYIKDLEKDFGVKDDTFKYKCINCNTYIKDEPQTERSSE